MPQMFTNMAHTFVKETMSLKFKAHIEAHTIILGVLRRCNQSFYQGEVTVITEPCVATWLTNIHRVSVKKPFLTKPLYTLNIRWHTAGTRWTWKNNPPPPSPPLPRPSDLPGWRALSLARNKQKQIDKQKTKTNKIN